MCVHMYAGLAAGCGKTSTLIRRIQHMCGCGESGDAALGGPLVDPKRVLVLTFSNQACKELIHRMSSGDSAAARSVTVKTYHSFAMQLLRMFGACAPVGVQCVCELACVRVVRKSHAMLILVPVRASACVVSWRHLVGEGGDGSLTIVTESRQKAIIRQHIDTYLDAASSHSSSRAMGMSSGDEEAHRKRLTRRMLSVISRAKSKGVEPHLLESDLAQFVYAQYAADLRGMGDNVVSVVCCGSMLCTI